jgi:hypothetical protein
MSIGMQVTKAEVIEPSWALQLDKAAESFAQAAVHSKMSSSIGVGMHLIREMTQEQSNREEILRNCTAIYIKTDPGSIGIGGLLHEMNRSPCSFTTHQRVLQKVAQKICRCILSRTAKPEIRGEGMSPSTYVFLTTTQIMLALCSMSHGR